MDAYKLMAYYFEQRLFQVQNVNGEVQQWGNHKLKPCDVVNHKNALSVTIVILEVKDKVKAKHCCSNA